MRLLNSIKIAAYVFAPLAAFLVIGATVIHPILADDSSAIEAPCLTPTPTLILSPTLTIEATSSATPMATESTTPTSLPCPTATPTSTQTATQTLTPTPTTDPDLTPTQTPSIGSIVTLTPTFTPAPTPSGVGYCGNVTPARPNIRFIDSNLSDGIVEVGWDTVDQASGYVLEFGTASNSYQYMMTDIGAVDRVEIRELDRKGTYYFRMYARNGCANSGHSQEIATANHGIAPTPTLTPTSAITSTPRPTRVPATSTPRPSVTASVTPDSIVDREATEAGSILGTSSGTCMSWKRYLPALLLFMQCTVALSIYVLFLDDRKILKQVGVAASTIFTIALFYYLRECNCFDSFFLAFLCKWYIIPAILLAILTQMVNYLAIEKTELEEMVVAEKTREKVNL